MGMWHTFQTEKPPAQRHSVIDLQCPILISFELLNSCMGVPLLWQNSQAAKESNKMDQQQQIQCTYTPPLFKEGGLLKFNDIFKLACIKTYYKFKNHMLPYYFNTLFDANQQRPQIERTGRTVVPPSRLEATIHDIPILTPTMPILFTNSKFN